MTEQVTDNLVQNTQQMFTKSWSSQTCTQWSL